LARAFFVWGVVGDPHSKNSRSAQREGKDEGVFCFLLLGGESVGGGVWEDGQDGDDGGALRGGVNGEVAVAFADAFAHACEADAAQGAVDTEVFQHFGRDANTVVPDFQCRGFVNEVETDSGFGGP
jgi:hypothetical protein